MMTRWVNWVGMLAMGPAPANGKGQPAQPTAFWFNLVPIIILFVVFYFLLIRPQQKKAKDHAKMLQTLRSGDKIVTSGGLVGVVITVKDQTVSIRSADAKLEVLKTSITEIREKASGSEGS